MSDNEKITMVRNMLGDSSADVSTYLASAKSAILLRAYPYGDGEEYLPPKYDMLQCRLAVRYFERAGAEGETKHTESDITRHYGSVNDEDLLMEVTPKVKVSV